MWITRLSCRCVNLTRLDLSNTQMTSEGLAMFVSPSKHKLKLHGSVVDKKAVWHAEEVTQVSVLES